VAIQSAVKDEGQHDGEQGDLTPHIVENRGQVLLECTTTDAQKSSELK